MRLKRKLLDGIKLKHVFTLLYFLCFFVYLVVGLSPAKAAEYEAATEIKIPAIGLVSDVVTLHVQDNTLPTPDEIVGRYTVTPHKTLLIGHSATVFQRLGEIRNGDTIYYDDTTYMVTHRQTYLRENIVMKDLLAAAEKDTIVIMTCAGQDLGGGEATHRLIVTAVAE